MSVKPPFNAHAPTKSPKAHYTARRPGASVLHHFLHLLLPPVCRLCGRTLPRTPHAVHLCAECIPGCTHQPPAACPICAEPYAASIEAGHPCPQCTRHPPAFTWLKTMGIHADDLQEAIHQLKYAGRFNLASPLAQLLLQRLHPDIADFSPQALVPVPLHHKRLRERGFNQSQLIAQHIGKTLDITTCSRYLVRTRATRAQTRLSREQRRQNLKGAFTLRGSIVPQRILLIDDVVTTSSTCRECANILVAAGHEVAVVALGRARLDS